MRARGPHAIALAALAFVVIATVAIVARDGEYVVRARFADAGQLVPGGLVEVAGRRVGTIGAIELTEDGLAEVELRLTDGDVRPLRRGTRATIRTVGLSGVANRLVDLAPGPATTAAIPDGGVLPETQTRGVVDLDAVLNAFTPEVRRDVRHLVRDAALALDPRAARQGNRALHLLNPAVSRLTALGRELTADEAALRSLLAHTSSAATTLARHRASLGTGIEDTAAILRTLADERTALASTLRDAPRAMRETTGTLRRLRARTLPAVTPALRAAGPALPPLDELLGRVEPTLDDARPVLAALERLLPQSRAALTPLPALHRDAAPAIASTTRALRDAQPMIAGLRPYTPELVAGFFTGFGGSTTHSYDANGHYARVNLEAGPGVLPGLSAAPGGGRRTGLDARCPGAAEEPAPDGSNPWTEGAGDTCDAKDGHR